MLKGTRARQALQVHLENNLLGQQFLGDGFENSSFGFDQGQGLLIGFVDNGPDFLVNQQRCFL